MSKYLSLNELQEQPSSASIWVINTSSSSIQQAGDILISIPNPNGRGSNIVTVPKTWLPVDITKEIPRSHLIDSFEFRQSLQKEHIAIISENYAKKLLHDPSAKDELKRLSLEKRQVQLQTSHALTEEQKQAAISSEKAASMEEEFVSVADLAKAGPEEYQKGISMNFKIWTDHLNLLEDSAVISEIRARRSFKRREVKFLVKHLKSTKAVTYLSAKLK